MSLDEQRVFRATDTSWREFDGEVTIISLEQNRVRQLNQVGSVVWSLCEGRTVGELGAAVAERFGVSVEQALADVRAFVDDLRVRGLVELK